MLDAAQAEPLSARRGDWAEARALTRAAHKYPKRFSLRSAQMLASALHLKRGAEATDDIRTRASEAASLGHGAAGSDSEWRTQVGWSASVRTGQGLFGSARTLEFDALVKARGQAGEEALADEIRDFWKGAFFSQPGDSRERAEAATRVTSERYHLLYYAGKQGMLNRVVPELAAKHRDK